MQKISPMLWFDGKAEEAAKFYVSIFKKSKITKIAYTSEAGPGPVGSVITVAFELDGQQFTALNGGPLYKFSHAISLVVNCKTQKEVDYYWKKLLAGGKSEACGWLKDKYGVSWQITPTILPKMITDKNPKKVANVMRAMMKMVKLDIAKLKAAYAK